MARDFIDPDGQQGGGNPFAQGLQDIIARRLEPLQSERERLQTQLTEQQDILSQPLDTGADTATTLQRGLAAAIPVALAAAFGNAGALEGAALGGARALKEQEALDLTAAERERERVRKQAGLTQKELAALEERIGSLEDIPLSLQEKIATKEALMPLELQLAEARRSISNINVNTGKIDPKLRQSLTEQTKMLQQGYEALKSLEPFKGQARLNFRGKAALQGTTAEGRALLGLKDFAAQYAKSISGAQMTERERQTYEQIITGGQFTNPEEIYQTLQDSLNRMAIRTETEARAFYGMTGQEVPPHVKNAIQAVQVTTQQPKTEGGDGGRIEERIDPNTGRLRRFRISKDGTIKELE